ncbi:MAG: tetratricopeptide repeat protein [Bradyrhizobium sp.]|nr:tetratricopeptide repeat protein [Bradyrhizobium sp.]
MAPTVDRVFWASTLGAAMMYNGFLGVCGVLLLGLALAPLPASARQDRDKAACARGATNEERIAACGRVLDRGERESREERSAAYVNRAFAYNNQHEYDLAIRDLDEAITINPRNSHAFNNRAWAFKQKGDYERALRDYGEALRVEPKNNVARVNLADAFRDKGEYDQSIRICEDALQQEPTNAYIFSVRARAYLGKGDRDRAVRDYDEAIRLNPKSDDFRTGRGDIFRERGDNERAVRDYDEAVRVNPKNWYANYARGLSDNDSGQADRALHDLDEALRINPRAAVALNLRGLIYRLQDKLDPAMEDLNEALRINPQFAVALANRGDVWRRKGDVGRALSDLNEALRLDPSITPAYVTRGLVLEKTGDTERARADYQTALSRTAGKFTTLKAALDTAREHLAALGGGTAPPAASAPPSRPAQAVPAPGASPVAAAATIDERGPRVALVIGNGAYANVTALANPPNDARDMASTLRDLGFRVIEGYNLDGAKMRSKIADFGAAMPGAGVTLFYYAGHGMQVAGKNYLVPVDAKLEHPSSLGLEAVEVSTVISDMESEKRINLVFLDACRDNPLSRSLARSMGTTRSASVGQGLAQLNAGIGTLITFATSPDTVALDGTGKNSPFTTALLKHIRTPGLEVRAMLTRVRADVIRATNEQQVPWDHSSLTGEFYFKPNS